MTIRHRALRSLAAASLALVGSLAAAQPAQPAPPPAPPFGMPIAASLAQRAATAALAKAAEIGVTYAVAVVEPSGDLVYFARMDGSPYSATALAQSKANASARYRRPTKFFYDMVEGGHPFFLTFPGVSAVPGGVPLVVDGKLVGAIGVSGGNPEQDMLVSGAGVDALK
jgi:glc operon protein GlcG